MALQWAFLLLFTPLLAVPEGEEFDPNTSGEPQEAGRKCSLLSSQTKVFVVSCYRVAVYLTAGRVQQLCQRELNPMSKPGT